MQTYKEVKIKGFFVLKMLVGTLCFCIAYCSIVSTQPMPNTDISVSLDESVVQLEIKIPVIEFVLSFPKEDNVTPKNLLSVSREKVEGYFKQHLKILSKNGVSQDCNLISLSIDTSSDEFVGEYQDNYCKV